MIVKPDDSMFDCYPFLPLPPPVTAPAPAAPNVAAPVIPTSQTVPPIVAPFVPAPVAPVLPPNPTRFRIRYGVCYCLSCTFPAAYCVCARTLPDAQSADGADSDLQKRINECKGG